MAGVTDAEDCHGFRRGHPESGDFNAVLQLCRVDHDHGTLGCNKTMQQTDLVKTGTKLFWSAWWAVKIPWLLIIMIATYCNQTGEITFCLERFKRSEECGVKFQFAAPWRSCVSKEPVGVLKHMFHFGMPSLINQSLQSYGWNHQREFVSFVLNVLTCGLEPGWVQTHGTDGSRWCKSSCVLLARMDPFPCWSTFIGIYFWNENLCCSI